MGVVEGVEELLDVDLQDPPARHAHRFVLQGLERLMRRTPRPEAIRAIQKLLFVELLE